MLYYYSPKTCRSKIKIVGYELFIEYRPRLKTFDLIFYPRLGKTYGASQYYDKFNCRHKDFIAFMACIIKASEDDAESANGSFYAFVRQRCSELILNEAMANAECPAQGSAICD